MSSITPATADFSFAPTGFLEAKLATSSSISRLYILLNAMGAATGDVNEARRTSISPLGRVVHKVLNNRLVEAVIVALLAVSFLATAVIDGILRTHAKRRLIDSLRDVSRDRLNKLRKAQIKHVFRSRFGLSKIRIKLAGGSYWLSIPCIVEGERNGRKVKYMAKIVNDMSEIKHRYMTMLRNLGVLAGAAELRFDEYRGAKDMVSFERYCLTRMKGELVNAPAVIGTFRLNEDDYMLVREFIEGQTLSDVPLDDRMLDQILGDVKLMHEHGFVHGDIKLDNFLVSDGTVYIVDCLKVGYAGYHEAKSFDLICTICAMCQKAPVSRVLEHARLFFSEKDLRQAGQLLDIAVSKVDIQLPDEKVRELRRALGNHV